MISLCTNDQRVSNTDTSDISNDEMHSWCYICLEQIIDNFSLQPEGFAAELHRLKHFFPICRGTTIGIMKILQ